jgi:hypothetical protein
MTETGTAEELINQTVDANDSSEAIIADLRRNQEQLEQSERADIDRYINGIRPAVAGMLVEDLGDGIGGVYDGSNVTMGKISLYVHDSIAQTIERAEEVSEHEGYHQDHDHTAAMSVGSSAEGDTVVTIGGETFDETALIEGLTVSRTGDSFVSEEYVQYETTLQNAVARAGISITDVEEAVNKKKDLSLIDDADRAQEEAVKTRDK